MENGTRDCFSSIQKFDSDSVLQVGLRQTERKGSIVLMNVQRLLCVQNSLPGIPVIENEINSRQLPCISHLGRCAFGRTGTA